MTNSMSHGNRWRSVSSKLSLSTRFVCARTSFSTNFWSNLFLLWEWIHPSTDQQYSHTDAEYMTPETLYANQASSLNRGSPVLLSVTPSKNVAIQVSWGSWSISGVKSPCVSSLTSSSAFKKCCYPGFLRKLEHFGGESTMSVVLDLVIGFSLTMFSSSILLSVTGMIFLVNVWRCVK